MRLVKCIFKSLCYLAVPSFLLAAGYGNAQTLPRGDYQQGGYGWMTIGRADRSAAQKFSIQTVGANGHTCDVSGVIRSGVAQLSNDIYADAKSEKDASKRAICELGFALTKERSIEVKILKQTHDGCRYYCGSRAGFDGEYWIPPTKCKAEPMKGIRDAFLAEYMARDFKRAEVILESIFPSCIKWMNYFEELHFRNDMAVLNFHLNRKDKCIEVLLPFTKLGITREQPTEETFADSDDYRLVWELIGAQPAFEDIATKAVKSARTNLKLCSYRFGEK